MKFTARQLVIRARELAALLLRSLERERLVARFVDSYAVEFERPCCTAYPGQYREIVANIRREALLAMIIWMEQELPRFLPHKTGLTSTRSEKSMRLKRSPVGKKFRARQSEQSLRNIEAEEEQRVFHSEFFEALGDALEWRQQDIEEFQRDLALYHKLMPILGVSRPRSTGHSLARHVEGPFVDRCAVLLDPSMLGKSRVAAARFQDQLRVATQTALNEVFSSRRGN